MLIPWRVHLSFEDWLVIPGVGEAAFDSGIATGIFGGAPSVVEGSTMAGGRGEHLKSQLIHANVMSYLFTYTKADLDQPDNYATHLL